MEKKYKIKISEDMISYIQRLMYQADASRSLLVTLINAHQNDAKFLDSAVYKKYDAQYQHDFTAYEELKKELEKKYVPNELTGHQYSWSVNFYDEELELTIQCECGAKIYEELTR